MLARCQGGLGIVSESDAILTGHCDTLLIHRFMERRDVTEAGVLKELG